MSTGTFRSLRGFNYRTWAAGALVSNVGTWMQRTAQDWVVLTELTDKSASAVGTVMALQFGPQVLLLPVTGFAADHLDRKKLLFATQSALGLLALGLGALTIGGVLRLWHVYLFAFLLGCVTAFDAPARQTFVSELVSEDDLSNAVALSSASFNSARLIGPAIAGVLIGVVGSGWVFVINAASFVAVLASLGALRRGELRTMRRAPRSAGSFVEGFRYVRRHPTILVVLIMLFLIGTCGLNFPIFISTMAVTVFHRGAGGFGALSSIMAIGSVTGALGTARMERPKMSRLVIATAVFGVGCALAASMPTYTLFGVMLVVVGTAAQAFTTSANGTVQLASDPEMRGRVMAILLAITLGGTPLGAPLVGWVADTFGPRWSMSVAAAGGILAALVGAAHLARGRRGIRSSGGTRAAEGTPRPEGAEDASDRPRE